MSNSLLSQSLERISYLIFLFSEKQQQIAKEDIPRNPVAGHSRNSSFCQQLVPRVVKNSEISPPP
jgi:hypothetical protein